MIWLYGAAGAGKSSIARTAGERLHERQILLAIFIFSKGDPTRNHPKLLVSTLAYGVATTVPAARHLIESVIDQDPYIFHRSFTTQPNKLILEPLRYLSQDGVVFPPMIIIDGLDECLNSAVQTIILDAISSIKIRSGLPLKFLVTSRTELAISTSFRTGSMKTVSIQHSLDDMPSSMEDIDYFLTANFDEIKRTHQLRNIISSDWPGFDQIVKLVWKSSGQFIYPATIIKYISSPKHHPMTRLDVILGLKPANFDKPFSDSVA